MNNYLELEELVDNIRSAQAKEYMKEAVACYRASAYRSSLISIWIAVCLDLYGKIDELAAQGDAAAISEKHIIDNAIQNNNVDGLLKFERELIRTCGDKLQIFGSSTAQTLNRLKEDRHACAHPNFSELSESFTPDCDIVRFYLRRVCEELLLHPPLQGKQLLDKLMLRVAEVSFPMENEAAFNFLNGPNYLGYARDIVLRNFNTLILKRVLTGEQDITLGEALRHSCALNASARKAPHIFSQTMREKINTILSDNTDRYTRRVFLLVSRNIDLWSHLSEANRTRLLGIIDTIPNTDIRVYKLVDCEEIDEISIRLEAKVARLTRSEKISILESNVAKCLKLHAIEAFVGAKSFASAASIGTNVLIPYASHFDFDDLNSILTGSLENSGVGSINQITNAGGMGRIFSKLLDKTALIKNSEQVWSRFWENLDRQQESMPTLKARLISMQIIDPEEELLVEESIEIPF